MTIRTFVAWLLLSGLLLLIAAACDPDGLFLAAGQAVR